jgi:hypothetical protein
LKEGLVYLWISVRLLLETGTDPPTVMREILRIHNHIVKKSKTWFSKIRNNQIENCPFFTGVFMKTIGSLRVLK